MAPRPVVLPLVAAAAGAWLVAQAVVPAGAEPSSAGGAVERGKYLVEHVAHCQECHTPRNDAGEIDRTRWLEGGPLWYRPAREDVEWAEVVPPIAGLPGWLEDEDAIRFLMTGERPDGTVPDPPMKQYHMSRADAEAVIAYLRSLRPPPK